MRTFAKVVGGIVAYLTAPFFGIAIFGLVGVAMMVVLGTLADGCGNDPDIPESCQHLRDEAFMDCYLES
jgi:hypothetical protein